MPQRGSSRFPEESVHGCVFPRTGFVKMSPASKPTDPSSHGVFETDPTGPRPLVQSHTKNQKNEKRGLTTRHASAIIIHVVKARHLLTDNIRSHGSVGRAHRSHRWGHRFESCCDHQSGKVLRNQDFSFLSAPPQGFLFSLRTDSFFDVDRLVAHPVLPSRRER